MKAAPMRRLPVPLRLCIQVRMGERVDKCWRANVQAVCASLCVRVGGVGEQVSLLLPRLPTAALPPTCPLSPAPAHRNSSPAPAHSIQTYSVAHPP